ncbi:MAG: hypothetical protein AB1611_02580 [bacterium]
MTAGNDEIRRCRHSLVNFAKTTVLFSLLMIFVLSMTDALAAIPPRQPSTGPGGAQYAHRSVRTSIHGFGDLQYYIFEPGGPQPDTAPLIVFTHGYGGTNPASYGAWIEHIVKRGNIVVYPKYQSLMSMIGGSFRYTSNCIKAVQDALEVLKSPGHVKPDLDKFATVGHSYGGLLTVNIAALAERSGLPTPRAVMSVQPGVTPAMPLEDLSLIPPETLLLTVVGDRDLVVGNRDAKKIFRRTPQIPLENKDYIIMVSDNHGLPGLSAGHFAPTCLALVGDFLPDPGRIMPDYGNLVPIGLRPYLNDYNLGPDFSSLLPDAEGTTPDFGGIFWSYFENLASQLQSDTPVDPATLWPDPISIMAESGILLPAPSATAALDMGSFIPLMGTNALDYYCTWKLFDALTDAAFYGKNREYALGNTPQQRFMGEWSDGKPVKELIVTDHP